MTPFASTLDKPANDFPGTPCGCLANNPQTHARCWCGHPTHEEPCKVTVYDG